MLEALRHFETQKFVCISLFSRLVHSCICHLGSLGSNPFGFFVLSGESEVAPTGVQPGFFRGRVGE